MTEMTTGPLLQWVLARFPDTPKSRAKQWILSGRVKVAGAVIRKPHQVMTDPGDALELGDRRATALDCVHGWVIHPRVTLVFLDAALAVVNKGPGLIAVPAPNTGLTALGILTDFLRGRLKPRALAGKALPAPYRNLELLPVHRLDQYTSGVFCMAASADARRHLINQLQNHSMKREYVAYAEGRCRDKSGTWRQWLRPGRDDIRQHVVSAAEGKASPQAQEAVTHYEVFDEFPLANGKGVVTKLRLRLETGRKHQIRVQAAHAGLPLVGDRTYNPRCRESDTAGPIIEFPRQALHAEILELEHPAQPGRRMRWTVELPKDLRELEAALRGGRL